MKVIFNENEIMQVFEYWLEEKMTSRRNDKPVVTGFVLGETTITVRVARPEEAAENADS
jgi:hypothetical protein